MTGGGIQPAGWRNEFASMMHALEHFTDGFVVLEGLFGKGSGVQCGVALVQDVEDELSPG